ncbi:MAG: alcohol dehydrogenase catalytic domain-containing protein [Anaerolineales bacterium]|nr:alcohol dehydrogenase catalytic domain-containing protein [Anaerolineales bacterium]
MRKIWPGAIWSPLSPTRVENDAPEPTIPGPRWVLVKNTLCGICSSDLSVLNLEVGPEVAAAPLPSWHKVYLGHEVVGEVIEIGSEVTRFKPGDRVVMESRFAGPTCFSQEIDVLCPRCANGQTQLCENTSLGLGPSGVGGGWSDMYNAHESELWPVPDEISDAQAILIEPSAVGLHAVLRRPPMDQEKLLVIGAGTISLLTIQIIKILVPSCHITVLARYPQQIELARKWGADKVIDEDNLYKALAQLTGAKYYEFMMNRGMLLGGFDLIYDFVGSANTITDSLRWARAGGTVVLIGIKLRMIKVDLNPIWFQEVDLIGSNTFGMEQWNGENRHAYNIVIDLMRTGKLDHQGLITHQFPLDDYREAVTTAIDKKTGSIKVTFRF